MSGCTDAPRSGRGRKWSTEPLSPDQQRLADQWIDMGHGHARMWSKHRPDLREEYESAAQLAVVRAAQNYDESVGKKFYTYLKWHLRHAKKEVLRASVPKGYRLTGSLRNAPKALARVRPTLMEWDVERDDCHAMVVGDAADLDSREWLEHHLGKLSPDHLAVCVGIYWYRRHPQEIADEMGCSRNEVVRLHEESLRALREVLTPGSGPALPPAEPTPPPSRTPPGAVVAALRKARGWTREDLAREAGVPANLVEQVESGRGRVVPAHAVALARALDQPADLLLALSGEAVPGGDHE